MPREDPTFGGFVGDGGFDSLRSRSIRSYAFSRSIESTDRCVRLGGNGGSVSMLKLGWSSNEASPVRGDGRHHAQPRHESVVLKAPS